MKTQIIKITMLLLSLFAASYLQAQDFNIYVSDATGNAIKQYDKNGTYIRDIVTPLAGGLLWPQDMVFLEDQSLMLVSGLTSRAIHKYDANTGEYLGDFANFSAGGPTRMKIGGDSLLYVLLWGSSDDKVQIFDLQGNFQEKFTSTAVVNSIGIDWDEDSNIYISSYNGSFVQKFDSLGNDKGAFISEGLFGPTNIWFNSLGQLNVINYNNGTIDTYDKDGSYVKNFTSGLNTPEGVGILPDDRILIGDGGSGNVKAFSKFGSSQGNFITGSISNLQTPNAVIIRTQNIMSATKTHTLGKIEVYPTAGEQFTFSMEDIESVQSITIYNELGQLIQNLPVKAQLSWNASKNPSGVYFAVIVSKSRQAITKKLIVQR